MLRLRDIMTTELVTLSPEHSLRDAMELLTTNHITGAPVVGGGKVVGIVSLTDLAEFAAGAPGVPSEQPDTAEPDDWENVDEPLDDRIPSNEWFAKFWEDAGADVVERIARTQGPEWNALEEHTVAEAMSRIPLALPPDTTIDRAADYMRRARIHRVLVMDEGQLLGVVTTTDLANTVADRPDPARVYVFGKPAASRGF